MNVCSLMYSGCPGRFTLRAHLACTKAFLCLRGLHVICARMHAELNALFVFIFPLYWSGNEGVEESRADCGSLGVQIMYLVRSKEEITTFAVRTR